MQLQPLFDPTTLLRLLDSAPHRNPIQKGVHRQSSEVQIQRGKEVPKLSFTEAEGAPKDVGG